MRQNDPLRSRKADRWDALVNSGVSPGEATRRVEQEFAAPEPQKTDPPLTLGQRAIGTARAGAQGLLAGFGEEIEALPRLIPGGESYGEAVQRIRGEMKQFSEAYPKTAMGAELLGGLATGVYGAGRAIAAKGLAKGVGKAIASDVGQGALSGAGAAEGDLRSRLQGALVGGTLGAAIPYVGGKAIRAVTPASRQIGEAAQAGYAGAQRMAANAAERMGMGRVASMVEPTDAVRIQREAAATLPGSTTGPVASSLAPAAVGTPQAVVDAQTKLADARVALRQAQSATARERQVAQDAVDQARRELLTAQRDAAKARRATERQAGAVEETGKGRRSKLLAAAQAQEEAVSQQERQLLGQARGIREAIPEVVARTEEEALANAERNAASFLQRLRVQRGSAKSQQDAIRTRQLAMGKQNYAEVAKIGPPPEVDPEVYREMLTDPTLRSAYEASVRELREEAVNKAPSRGVRTPLPGVKIDEQALPEISLEMFDRIRRRVLEPTFKVGPNATGLSASQRRATLEQMDRLEQTFLAGYGDDAAATALKNARTQYRAEFKLLEAIQDGLNLGSARPGRASGVLRQSRQELDEVISRVGAMSDAEREAFQLGAREAIDRQIQRSQKGAIDFLSKFGSEEMRDKLRLAYGDEMVGELEALALGEARKGAKAAGAAVRAAERGRVAGIQQQAAQLVESLTGTGSKAERARRLAERARTQAGERAGALREQKFTAFDAARDAAEQQFREAQQAAGAPVRAARQVQQTAQEEANRLAEELAKARRSQTVAQRLPVVSSINQALGGSTQQQEFLQRVFPRLDATQQQQAATIIGSNVQRRLQDLARSGKAPQEILREIQMLKQNDVVRQLFGGQIDAFAQSIFTPSFASRLPGQVRPALAAALARRFAPEEEQP